MLEQLERHLSVLRHEEFISTWYKCQLAVGGNWQAELSHHLITASLILLLVSSDFLVSDYCYGTEMRRALQRYEANEAILIPLLLRHCYWQHTPLVFFQVLPTEDRLITMCVIVMLAGWMSRETSTADCSLSRGIETLSNHVRE